MVYGIMTRLSAANLELREAALAHLRAHPDRTLNVAQVQSATRLGRYYGEVYNQLRAMARSGLLIWHDWMAWYCPCEHAHGQYGCGFQAAPFDPETGLLLADLAALQDVE